MYKFKKKNLIITKILNNIIDYKKKYKTNHYVISFSGGLDSTVLLDAIFFIKKFFLYDLKIKAIHINHNLNKKSNYWETNCRKECKKRKIKLIVKKINISDEDIKNYGIEYASRKIRYKEISKKLKKKEILLLAHHKNDKIETFFLSLKRGCGPKGLTSIKEFNTIYKCKILRPLLKIKSIDLKNYANFFKLNYIEDDSNHNNLIDRNFIRNNIISKLEEKWPSFIETSSRSIDLCYKNENILKKILNHDLNNLIQYDNSINIEYLKKKNEDYINLIIRYWLEKLKFKMPSYKTMKEIYKEIISDTNKYKPLLKIKLYDNFYIKKIKNFMFCVEEKFKINPYTSIWKNKKNIFILPYELGYLSLNKNYKKHEKYNYKFIQKIRRPKKHEIISIHINNISNKIKIKIPILNKKTNIKNIFQYFKIKPWNRKKTPLIFYNEKLISIIGISITNEGLFKNTNFLNLIWIK